MAKTRSQIKQAEKKQVKQEKKAPEKKQEYEFKNNPNFTPVASGDLKHKMLGREFFYVKFRGKNYTHDKIQRFTQKIAKKYADAGEAEYIQLALDYENEGFRSSKISKTSEDLNLTFDEQYAEIQGQIKGFIIYLA